MDGWISLNFSCDRSIYSCIFVKSCKVEPRRGFCFVRIDGFLMEWNLPFESIITELFWFFLISNS